MNGSRDWQRRRIIRKDGNFLGKEEKKRRREAKGERRGYIYKSTRAPELVIVTIPDLEMKSLVRSKLKVLSLIDVIVSILSANLT